MERGRGRLRGKETFQMFSSFTAAAAALFLIYNSLMGLSWTEKHEKKSYHQRRHSAAVAPSNLYYCHRLLGAIMSSGILKAKQKMGVTFNFDKQDVSDLTKFSKMTMCRASEANSEK